jgi:hypothetical protein
VTGPIIDNFSPASGAGENDFPFLLHPFSCKKQTGALSDRKAGKPDIMYPVGYQCRIHSIQIFASGEGLDMSSLAILNA